MLFTSFFESNAHKLWKKLQGHIFESRSRTVPELQNCSNGIFICFNYFCVFRLIADNCKSCAIMNIKVIVSQFCTLFQFINSVICQKQLQDFNDPIFIAHTDKFFYIFNCNFWDRFGNKQSAIIS